MPPVGYVTKLAKHGGGVIDEGEHFVKRTIRNRCEIAGANGKIMLSVPLQRQGDLTHVPMKDIRISYDTEWRHQHYASITSAYRMSAYYDYFDDDVRRLYEQRFKYLTDLNVASLELMLKLMDIDEVKLTRVTEYTGKVKSEDSETNGDCVREYYQVFGGKYGFVKNLSVMDMAFNMGPESRIIVRDQR